MMIRTIHDAYLTGSLSPAELFRGVFATIAATNPALNCFCALYEEEALARAGALGRPDADDLARQPLWGIPIALKDLTPVAGKVTTMGSHHRRDWIAPTQPAMVTRLQAAGAIIVGKTTTSEFAFDGGATTPLFGSTRNPWDDRRSPGGSSGGSGVAVATGCVPLAEGSDMGGSVRIPAAFCGVVGLKPSRGRIPFDLFDLSFDPLGHFGPLAQTVDDAALFVDVTEGYCRDDPHSAYPYARIAPPLDDSLAGLRIGLSIDLGIYKVDADVAANLVATASALERRGAALIDLDFAVPKRIHEVWNTHWAVLHRVLHGEIVARDPALSDPRLVALIASADNVTATQFLDNEKVKGELWRRIAAAFDTVDVLLCPTTPGVAPELGHTEADLEFFDADGRFSALDMTVPFSCVSVCPALSVPSGMSRGGLPTAAQIVGRPHQDEQVLRVGKAIERARPWTVFHRFDGTVGAR